MENIKFEITERDIKEYLKQHKQDETIKYREAMFVKYLKEQKDITCEALEILTKKYNWEDRVISGTYQYDYLGILKQESLPNFNSYLSRFHNLDISGICHMLIPIIRYYDWDRSSVSIGRMYADLYKVAETLNIPMNQPWNILESTIDDYKISSKIKKEDKLITFKLGREHSRHELMMYSQFYDENKVKQIRKIIRERV